MFSRTHKNSRYSKLENGTNEDLEFEIPHSSNTKYKIIVALTTIISCIFSFYAGWMLRQSGIAASMFEDIIPAVPVTGRLRQQVLTMHDIQAAPPPDGTHEPAWDKLIPNGLGYVKHPEIAPNVSVIGIFHQLHCLYTVRRAYYAAYFASIGKEFNSSGVREPSHIAHCMDYLQQSLICNADTGIEPLFGNHYPDVMFGRECRDFGQVQKWAEEWRVLNGSGFIFDFPQ